MSKVAGLLDPHTLARAVDGDMAAFAAVRAHPHAALVAARRGLPALAVGRPALARVLHALRDGQISDADARAWASFVRRGFVEGRAPFPLAPIDICYCEADEDLVVEVVGRLDELGDLIDGEISQSELSDLLSRLEA